MMNISSRILYFLGFLFSLGAIAASFYLQFYKNLEPCPLCIVQRSLIMLLGLLCFIGLYLTHLRQLAQRLYAGMFSLIALLGAASALRKIWLEHLPRDRVPPCGPSLQYMLDHLPFHKTLETLLMGSGDCSQVEWQFLGLALSEWTLLVFLVFIGLGLWQIYRTCASSTTKF